MAAAQHGGAGPLRWAALSVAAAVLGLAACGGGGSGPGPTSAQPAPAAPAPPPTAAPTPAPAPPPGASTAVPTGYRLVWAEEFDLPGLPDPTRWSYDTERNRFGWWNNELQYYAEARAENSVVRDGRLRITARLESTTGFADAAGQRYTSARLITRGKAAWTYGFFEIRARMPCGQGTWPAIWMLGTGGVWPDDGEIDILEHTGSQPTRVLGTVHTRASFGTGTSGHTTVATACTAFHDYQLHWTRDELTWFVNGVAYHRYRNPRTGRVAWPFDEPQYLLLNIAIGGTLGGAVDDRIFPRTLEVEHVRVWQAPPA